MKLTGRASETGQSKLLQGRRRTHRRDGGARWSLMQAPPDATQPLGQEPRTCGTACGASPPDGMHCPPLQR